MDCSKRILLFMCALSALAASSASAQPAVNLNGIYRCVQGCVLSFEGRPAFVTQNGWNINIVTEAGIPVQALIGMRQTRESGWRPCIKARFFPLTG